MGTSVSALRWVSVALTLVFSLAWMSLGQAAATALAAPASAPAPVPASEPAALAQAKQRLQDAQQRIQMAKDVLKNGSNQLAVIQQQLSAPMSTQALAGLDVPALESLRQKTLAEEQDASSKVQALSNALSALEKQKPRPPQPILITADAGASAVLSPLQSVQTQVNDAEKEAYLLEISSQPMAVQLAHAQMALAERQLRDTQARLQAIDQMLDRERLNVAHAALQETPPSEQYAGQPDMQRLAQSNEKLAQTLVSLTERLSDLTQAREKTAQQTASLQEEMSALMRQLEQFGFGPIMGRLLLEKRASLPSAMQLKRQSQDNRVLLETLQDVEIKVQQERAELLDPDAFLQGLPDTLSRNERALLRADAEKLLATRKTVFASLASIKPAILQAIASQEYALEELRRTVSEYKNFIARNLLWLPNERPVWHQTLSQHWAAMQATLGAINVDSLIASQAQALRAYPLLAALFALLVLALIVLRPRLNARLQAVVEEAAHPSFKVWLSALRCLLLVFPLALPVPLILLGLGGLLYAESQPMHTIVANNMLGMASVWLNTSIFLWLVRSGGVAEKMFGWNPRGLEPLRGALRVFLYVALPLDLLTSVHLDLASIQRSDHDSGQLLLIALLFLLAFILGRLFRPHGAFSKSWRATHPAHVLSRHPTLIFVLATGIPLFFAVLAAEGYTYSAGVLTQTFASSLWVMLALILFNGFASMALQRAYRRLAQQRRQQEQVRPSDEPLTDGSPSSAMEMDVIAAQSGKLLSFSLLMLFVLALYFVWAPVLPAFSLLDQVSLWNVQQVVNGSAISSAVSLGDALLTAATLLVLWVAARNLPGLMEIMLEQWTTHEAGTRYAITTILRYIIMSAGIVILLGGLGVQWSQLQWLVAALGVGLGFGLQEIFANFISGIIILLERPVRVGDLVTIGTQTGTIRRIHMRATVLEDFDRKEIVVPNKQLITQSVTNWTLSDTTTRVLVDIGVAYGSEPREVERLLLQAAAGVPRLLREPAPLVWFMGFGDNALNFRIRGFVDDADIKQGVTSELNYAVEKTLREHNINIPFPQRDVHIPALDALSSALKDHLSATRAHPAQGAST